MLAELARRVRKREVSARELVAAAIGRIESLDGGLNAVVQRRFAEALEEAEAIDRALSEGRDPGPLAGLPALIKEADDVAGMRTTHGSLLLAEAPPAAADGRVPALLRAAGAVIVGKTNIPEFCFEGHSANRLFGATRNPWAPDYSPGGSSGGSGAALAAGLVAVATASDGGGSIRIPAAFCGLVGLKPTNGRVGRESAPAWLDLTTDGPLTHTVADAALLLSLMVGPAPGDIYAAAPLPAPAPRLPGRVLAAERISSRGPLPEPIADLFAAAVRAVEEDLGLPVVWLESPVVPEGEQLDADWYTIAAVEQAAALGTRTIEGQADLFDPVFLEMMRGSFGIGTEEYLAARRRRWEYARALDSLLAGQPAGGAVRALGTGGRSGPAGIDTVLLTPTMNLDGFLADGRLPGSDPDGSPEPTPAWAYNTNLANMTGAPAVSLPAGRCPNGVPFGIQVMAGRFREDLLLGFAQAWERARPWPALADGFSWFFE